MIPRGWERKGGTAIASIDGKWTIAKVTLAGVITYEVWRLTGRGWKQVRVHLPDLDSAIAVTLGEKREVA